jgi:hypothetical protein
MTSSYNIFLAKNVHFMPKLTNIAFVTWLRIEIEQYMQATLFRAKRVTVRDRNENKMVIDS